MLTSDYLFFSGFSFPVTSFSLLISHLSFPISHLSYRVKTFDKSFKVGKMCIINTAKVLFHTNHQL